jgi:hypothetical protein
MAVPDEGLLNAVGQLFAQHGEMPHQHPGVLSARLGCPDCADCVVAVYSRRNGEPPELALALRQRPDGVWVSLFPGAPILASLAFPPELLGEILAALCRELGASALYFPLAYAETRAAHLLQATPAMDCWQRSPSPIISWDDGGEGLIGRFMERYGSQAARKRKRWQSLRAVTLPPLSAVQALAAIGANSWKSSLHADLQSNGQLQYYQRLLLEGLVELTVATLDEYPIAYRLDSLFRERVYALEWSFDQRYAALAPGMFLLLDGLLLRWGREKLHYIDLFGSPDRLKTLVETDRRARVDFAWPAGSVTELLRRERSDHDLRLAGYLARGVGIRRIYSEMVDR